MLGINSQAFFISRSKGTLLLLPFLPVNLFSLGSEAEKLLAEAGEAPQGAALRTPELEGPAAKLESAGLAELEGPAAKLESAGLADLEGPAGKQEGTGLTKLEGSAVAELKRPANRDSALIRRADSLYASRHAGIHDPWGRSGWRHPAVKQRRA